MEGCRRELSRALHEYGVLAEDHLLGQGHRGCCDAESRRPEGTSTEGMGEPIPARLLDAHMVDFLRLASAVCVIPHSGETCQGDLETGTPDSAPVA
ncbi:hypothetical protein D9M70_505140 [compost metagenome]